MTTDLVCFILLIERTGQMSHKWCLRKLNECTLFGIYTCMQMKTNYLRQPENAKEHEVKRLFH